MKRQYIAGLMVLSLFFSCEFDPIMDQPPQCTPLPSFEPSHFDRATNAPISFLNVTPVPTVECPYTYVWDFGDGSPIHEGKDPPAKAYETEGTYGITLTVTTVNPPIESAQFDQDVRIFDPLGPPVAVPAADPEACSGPCTIELNGLSSTGNIEYYHWDLGYEGQRDTGVTITHVFPPRDQAYEVRLTVGNSNGDENTAEIEIPVGWVKFVKEGFEMQNLGKGIHISTTNTNRYNIVGSQIDGANEGIYSLLADRNGDLVGEPTVLQNLSSKDIAHHAIRLSSTGDIMVVGSTQRTSHPDNLNDILFLRFNPLAPNSSPTVLSFGEFNRRELGRAVCEVIDGSQISLAVAGEVIDGGIYSVYFNRFSLIGTMLLPTEQLIQLPGVTTLLMEVKDIVQTSNGHYWICGWLDAGTGDLGQAFILELDNDGNYEGHHFLGTTADLDQFLGMTTNATNDQLLVVGTSINLTNNSRTMIYSFVDQDNLAGAVLEYSAAGDVEAGKAARLLSDGNYLIGGSSAGGPAVQRMKATGDILDTNADFGGFTNDEFLDGIDVSDGGYVIVGTKGAKLLFVKTDDRLRSP
ncbi:MAG: PKD domain-containing protein [Bacteroidota bacterium]